MVSALFVSLLFATGIVAQTPPASFTPLPTAGGGGNKYTDSAHFRVYGDSVTASQATAAINELEGAYSCFVDTLQWRSTGLSYNSANDNGPWYKTNIYGVTSLPGAAGVMGSDANSGMAFLTVLNQYLATPTVTVHEWGHGLTYHERYWVDQGRTGAWWETVANWVADTYTTSDLCAAARSKWSQPQGQTEINLRKVIGDSFQVIVDGSANTGNYYEAWPFLTYLTNNPDNYAGLGKTALRDMIRKYSRGSNETPLHALARVATGATVQKIVGRYWARMAFVDIGHPQAQQLFLSQRGSLNYNNLQLQSTGVYKVLSARQPKYMGSNIVPLKGTGAISVKITTTGAYTATVAVRNKSSGAVRYVDVVSGAASVTVASTEEATLVVANTPANLILYDGFSITGDVAKGLDYTVQLTGATV